jgi:fibronectin-binding autotransporter adhesin
MKHPMFARLLLIPLATLIAPTVASAVTIDKANNTTDLDQPGSWVGGVVPTQADVVRWNNTVTGPNSVGVTMVTGPTYAGMIIADPGGSVTLVDGLGLGASGLDMSGATQDLTVGGPFRSVAVQTWNIASGRKVTLEGSVTNSPSLITISGGTVVLTGTENNTSGRFDMGGTALNPGLLLLDKTSSPTIHAINGFGVQLTISPFGTARLTGSGGDQIAGTTGINVAGGTFDLNGQSEAISALSGSPGGRVTSGVAGNVTFTATSGTYAGIIEDGNGTVNFVKDGAGTLTFSGANTYTGTTQVNAGTLAVTGSISDSLVSLASGATLAGDGIVGALTLASGSIVSPGVANTATLDISGALIFNGGTFTAQLNGTGIGNYDQLSVANAVTLSANVALNLSLGFTAGFDSFTILNNLSGSAISGPGLFTFNGEPLSEGELFQFSGYDATISYVGGDGNDVVLSVPEPGSAALLLAGTVACIRRRRSVARS